MIYLALFQMLDWDGVPTLKLSTFTYEEIDQM